VISLPRRRLPLLLLLWSALATVPAALRAAPAPKTPRNNPTIVLDSPAGRAEQELEVRQMLIARSERMVGRGQPALDIDAEVARLLGPPERGGHSPGLTEEVRQLVVARNERRVRQGLEPLDVDAEVTRTLEEFDP